MTTKWSILNKIKASDWT